jgi:nucleotide-binding universal stress UspA family protein
MKTRVRHLRSIRPALPSDEDALPAIQVGTLKPKIILAPVDFTDCSMKAVTYAVSLAKHFGGEIILLHVSGMATPTPAAELVAVQGVMLDEQLREDATMRLAQWLDRVSEHVPARAIVTSAASVQEEIVETARKTRSDLIVIATHGRTGLAHLFSGSVAEKVVQHAPCPVFVVREREHDFIQPRSRKRRPLGPLAATQ